MLAQKAQQEVFDFDLVAAKNAGLVPSEENRPSRFFGVFFEHTCRQDSANGSGARAFRPTTSPVWPRRSPVPRVSGYVRRCASKGLSPWSAAACGLPSGPPQAWLDRAIAPPPRHHVSTTPDPPATRPAARLLDMECLHLLRVEV